MSYVRDTGICPRCSGSGAARVHDGAAMRRDREAHGISLRRMAALIDVSPTYLSDIERNQRNAPERVLAEYREAFRQSSVAQGASASPQAPAPAVVCEPARQQPSSNSKPFPVVGAACGADDQPTTRRA